MPEDGYVLALVNLSELDIIGIWKPKAAVPLFRHLPSHGEQIDTPLSLLVCAQHRTGFLWGVTPLCNYVLFGQR